MSSLDPYEDWRQARRRERPPDDLPDRVMERVRNSRRPRSSRAGKRWAAAQTVVNWAASLAAAAAFLWRLSATLSFFLAS